MNTILKSLRALPLALILAFGFVSVPAASHSDEASVSDNQFVDGNWFSIAAAKGESYKNGSPTNKELNAQLALYQSAVDEKNTADAERYAIRSWVKANYAAELGRLATAAGNYDEAKQNLDRALNYAKAAQKPGAGKGEQEDRVCDDTAEAWRGCSEIEGKRAEAYVKKLQARLKKKSGQ